LLLPVIAGLAVLAASKSSASGEKTCQAYQEQCVSACRSNGRQRICQPPQDCDTRRQLCEAHKCWPTGSGVCIPLGAAWTP
jgi:hypothetical protein